MDTCVIIVLYLLGVVVLFLLLFSCLRFYQHCMTRRRERSVSIEQNLV